MTEVTGHIKDLWPVVLFILGIIWKQIVTHFDVKSIKDECTYLNDRIRENEREIHQVKIDLQDAIKEQGKETNQSIQRLVEVTGELVATTKVMASELGFLKDRR
jgi:cell division protein FtsB